MKSTVVKAGVIMYVSFIVTKIFWEQIPFCTEFYSDPAHTYQSRVESRDDWSLLFIWIYCLYSHYIRPQLSWNYLRKQQNLNALWTYTTFIFLLYFVALLCFSVFLQSAPSIFYPIERQVQLSHHQNHCNNSCRGGKL